MEKEAVDTHTHKKKLFTVFVVCVRVDLEETQAKSDMKTLLCEAGSLYLTQFCFVFCFFFFAITGVIFVGVIYKCKCTYI